MANVVRYKHKKRNLLHISLTRFKLHIYCRVHEK